MNRERLPKSGVPGYDACADSSAEVTVRLTRAELLELDRFCAERKLTRERVMRRAINAHLLERAIGQDE
jgi:hypothetical protein